MKGSNTMAKNTKTTTNDHNEQETFNRINGITHERAAAIGEQVKSALTKAAEKAERERKQKQAREVGRCFLASVGIAGLYMAQAAGLISPVLTIPVYAIAFVYLGWHLCEIRKGRK